MNRVITYQKIKDYVKDKYGLNVYNSYIIQIKRMCGLDMGENYNKLEEGNSVVEHIKEALRYFELIQ